MLENELAAHLGESSGVLDVELFFLGIKAHTEEGHSHRGDHAVVNGSLVAEGEDDLFEVGQQDCVVGLIHPLVGGRETKTAWEVLGEGDLTLFSGRSVALVGDQETLLAV